MAFLIQFVIFFVKCIVNFQYKRTDRRTDTFDTILSSDKKKDFGNILEESHIYLKRLNSVF